MRPEEIAARLDATWQHWAIGYGRMSKQYIAFPLLLGLPPEHQGHLVATDPRELEHRMAAVQGISWVVDHSAPAHETSTPRHEPRFVTSGPRS
jgi:hypothetical protein